MISVLFATVPFILISLALPVDTVQAADDTLLAQLRPLGEKQPTLILQPDALGSKQQAQTSAARGNGYTCVRDTDCTSGHCADGKKCAPQDGKGQGGDYCHHDNHCKSNICACPGNPNTDRGFCRDWESWPEGQVQGKTGFCVEQLPNGQMCTRNEDCRSGHCADGKRCAPKDGTGKAGDYCHHNNHCASKNCHCKDWDGNDFCGNWKDTGARFTNEVRAGFNRCMAGAPYGADCNADWQCEQPGKCADGRVCAPEDGKGEKGDYCHHDNHCKSRICGSCVKNGPWCHNWEAGRNVGKCL